MFIAIYNDGNHITRHCGIDYIFSLPGNYYVFSIGNSYNINQKDGIIYYDKERKETPFKLNNYEIIDVEIKNTPHRQFLFSIYDHRTDTVKKIYGKGNYIDFALSSIVSIIISASQFSTWETYDAVTKMEEYKTGIKLLKEQVQELKRENEELTSKLTNPNNSKLKFGYTFHGNTGELSGLAQDYLLTKSDTSFFTVQLKIYGGYEIEEFSDLNPALEHSRHHNAVYRFLEYSNIEAERRILVVHNVPYTDKFVGYQNYYGIGGDWKLYVNSKSDIVVQHMQFPNMDITVRFKNFPTGIEFYVNLSCLIYVLTNYKLLTETDIKSTFQKVQAYLTNRTEV
jgi:hypothetical protein